MSPFSFPEFNKIFTNPSDETSAISTYPSPSKSSGNTFLIVPVFSFKILSPIVLSKFVEFSIGGGIEIEGSPKFIINKSAEDCVASPTLTPDA